MEVGGALRLRLEAPAFAKASAFVNTSARQVGAARRKEDRQQTAEDGVDAVSCPWSVARKARL